MNDSVYELRKSFNAKTVQIKIHFDKPVTTIHLCSSLAEIIAQLLGDKLNEQGYCESDLSQYIYKEPGK